MASRAFRGSDEQFLNRIANRMQRDGRQSDANIYRQAARNAGAKESMNRAKRIAKAINGKSSKSRNRGK